MIHNRSSTTEDPQAIPAMPPGVKVVTLDNGLVLILREDHNAPVVSAQAWCQAGSINEGKWIGGGLSHVLEHMLFKGTHTRPSGRIDQEVQDAGGYMNAYTSFDRTVYYINVPNTGARVAVDILCDIMQNAAIPQDELEKEKEVIRREMDMNQDDPGQRSARRLFETAYTRSPYRFTIIGYPDIYNEVTREDVYVYYREKYAPNNVFFVVVGDFQATEIEAQIRAAFAQAKARAIAPAVLPEEPRQTAPREVIEEAAIELGHLHYSWHVPELRHPDVAVLDVLSTLLGNGRSSRLYRQIRQKKGLATAIDSWTYSPGNPGLFGASALVEPEKFQATRIAILEEIDRMKSELIPAEELAKAVRQFTAWTLASRKTMQGQAQDLGSSWMSARDLNFSARYLETVKRVTPGDLQRVARQYLTEENKTLYALLPTGTAPATGLVLDQHVEHPVQLFHLDNGLRLLVKEDHRLPFVEYRVLFKGGVLAETAANNGITHLATKLLMQGTTTRNAEELAIQIESLGGSLESYGGNNSFGLSAEVLKEDFLTGLELVADVLLHPAFPADALEREREIQLSNIKAQKDELLQTAGRLMRAKMFGETGYGLHSLGSETSVPQLSLDQIRHFYEALAVPNNCVIAIFGDVETSAVVQAVKDRFVGWQRGAAALQDLQPPKPLLELRRITEWREKKQAVLIIGFSGAALNDPARYALELIQEACSDLGSRLFMRVREKLGLAYYVGAQNFLGLVPGFFAFYVGTEPEQVQLVEREMLKEAELLREEGLSEEELKRSKAKVIGQKKIARQDLGGYAMNSALDELYGLGYANVDTEDAQYEAVTLDEIKAAANRFLRPDALVISSVQPQTSLETVVPQTAVV